GQPIDRGGLIEEHHAIGGVGGRGERGQEQSGGSEQSGEFHRVLLQQTVRPQTLLCGCGAGQYGSLALSSVGRESSRGIQPRCGSRPPCVLAIHPVSPLPESRSAGQLGRCRQRPRGGGGGSRGGGVRRRATTGWRVRARRGEASRKRRPKPRRSSPADRSGRQSRGS